MRPAPDHKSNKACLDRAYSTSVSALNSFINLVGATACGAPSSANATCGRSNSGERHQQTCKRESKTMPHEQNSVCMHMQALQPLLPACFKGWCKLRAKAGPYQAALGLQAVHHAQS